MYVNSVGAYYFDTFHIREILNKLGTKITGNEGQYMQLDTSSGKFLDPQKAFFLSYLPATDILCSTIIESTHCCILD